MPSLFDPIAIIGFSFRLPQDVTEEDGLWEVLLNRRNLMTEWPENRANVAGFHNSGTMADDMLPARGGHFVNQDPAVFDAPFFSITPGEAAAMDPSQRWALEASYLAFENAGMPLEKLNGSSTAVFGSCMSEDYKTMLFKDPQSLPRTTATGNTTAIFANRISWFFNLVGPSIVVDTACSGSMVALDLACQLLHNGDASMALVVGANLLLAPESTVILGNMGFLSPDGCCFSFDKRANGYARGEGVLAMIVKPLVDAVADNDTIRAIIRSTGSNQDGRTPSLTQPNAISQEKLIRHVYQKAGLDPHLTRYVEAHGTGTPTGDPIETTALLRAFGDYRSQHEPLYIGSIKSNIGHLEGGSGLASIIKTVLILEKGLIPPNALLDEVNPNIDTGSGRILFPKESVKWPGEGIRRASINSFGIGGTNSHLVLDDACKHLHMRRLQGNHLCRLDIRNSINGTEYKPQDVLYPIKLLVWSAADEGAVRRMMKDFEVYYGSSVINNPSKLNQLAYTLAERRSRMAWRVFATLDATESFKSDSILALTKPIRALNRSVLAFIFTGQGAHYVDMGLELLQYPVFERTLQGINNVYAEVGCRWNLIDELHRKDHIGLPEYSQPLCTALQIALVKLLREFGVNPSAVVGHSSGEIAAAYTTGALSERAASIIAYHRGQLAGKLKNSTVVCHSMMSVNLSKQQVPIYLASKSQWPVSVNNVQIACVNSPQNCTLAGTDEAMCAIQEQLEKDKVFAQKLDVGVAYHTKAMLAIAAEYSELLACLTDESVRETNIPMVSSVTGKVVPARSLVKPQYWVENLVSPVRFSNALLELSQLPGSILPDGRAVTDVVEIGPHPALRRYVHDTFKATPFPQQRKEPGYYFLLHREKNALRTFLEFIGRLFCLGYPVSLSTTDPSSQDQPPAPLVDYPQYPLNQSLHYWAEPRVDGIPVFPGAGALVMAIEAVKQQVPSNLQVSSYLIKQARFLNPIVVDQNDNLTETILYLWPSQEASTKDALSYQVKICANRDGSRWLECFTAHLQVEVDQDNCEVDRGKELHFEAARFSEKHNEARAACDKSVSQQAFYEFTQEIGIQYLKSFQLLHEIVWDRQMRAMASVRTPLQTRGSPTSLLHPTVLDAYLQLTLVPISDGISSKIDARVPSHLRNAWISAKGWDAVSAEVSVTAREIPGAGNHANDIHVISNEGRPLCVIEDLVLKKITAKRETSGKKGSKLLYGIDWKPQLSLLSPQQLRQWCHRESSPVDEPTLESFLNNMESALIISLRQALRRISDEDLRSTSPHIKRYLSAVQRYTTEQFDSLDTQLDELDQLLSQCEQQRPDHGVTIAAARNLRELITRERDPLEVFFKDGLAERFYDSMTDDVFKPDVKRFLDLASHEKPNLRLLEVGAGTGSMTKRVLATLLELEARDGAAKFQDYTYTDISTAFFQAAQDRFHDSKSRIIYRKLDLEFDPIGQGYEEGAYDIILAGSVLHATVDLTATLRKVRRLLKPQGHLMFIETHPSVGWVNIVWGLLPGWWLSKEDWRVHSPLASEQKWDELLRETGFTGNNVVVRDSEGTSSHVWSLVISTAARESPIASTTLGSGHDIIVIVDPKSQIQQLIAEILVNQQSGSIKCLSEAHCMKWEPSMILVSLLEVGTPFLADISKEGFDQLQQVVSGPQRVLWVTLTGISDTNFPKFQLATGFFRTLQSESPSKRFVTLAIESCDTTSPDSVAVHVSQILMTPLQDDIETDYVVRDGLLNTGRLLRSPSTGEKLDSLVSPKLREEPWQSGSGIKLEIGTPGILDTLRFVEDPESDHGILALEEVEIELKTWPVSFRDLMISLGQLEGEDGLLGLECAGIVTRVGSRCSNREPGDPVILIQPGSARSHPRAHWKATVKIPNSLSLEDAVSVINPAMAAYHSLVDLARIKKGEKVLIHSAAGSTGQMAILIANWIGAEVFATVGYDYKKDFLVREFNVAEDHIFYSRDLSFAKGIMRMTHGLGVNVILNSLSGQALQSTWECIAPYGRFVEMGKTDIQMNTLLPMGQFRKNVSFFALDVQHISQTDLDLTQSLLTSVVDMLTSGIIKPPIPTRVFPPRQIEEAFRTVQSGKHTGRVMVTIDQGNVTKFTRGVSYWELDANASYVIAGGFGGLGRCIIGWLVKKGAKHIIILSRSGTSSSPMAAELVSWLELQGVLVAAPCCDLCSPPTIQAVLAECDCTMPPVKGYINSANILQDSIFENMTYEQWDLTVRTKVMSSWTLHELLPTDLDFFVLLSSVSGLHGIPSQSNYAASCTYQDALARYRVTHGHKAISFDIGWMQAVGIVAETDRYIQTTRAMAHVNPISEDELLALLDIYCNPSLEFSAVSPSQIAIGAMTAADAIAEGKKPTQDLLRPMFSAFLRPANSSSEPTTSDAPAEDESVQFRHAKTPADRLSIVLRALVGKVARLLYVGADDIDEEKYPSDYGVDSLIAVELRNWLSYDFKASVATFEIMGGKSIASLASSVVERSQLAIDSRDSSEG
ncbi:hypothetical protein E0Z10_g10141 [Xylaria hypoxylon]|uniref:Uncharacterized protein n=1 Tax=Xylaria hypoxylon TaxID=37992 RepID=A0A4Z0YIQ2_9PEZI|nr:hypothetical protein E0Z10_g10141 [Xylaria hypoxylon]